MHNTKAPHAGAPSALVLGKLVSSASDRRDQHNLVSVLERIRFTTKEADIFIVHIDIDEAAQLAIITLDLCCEERSDRYQLIGPEDFPPLSQTVSFRQCGA
jgi:hypothetical protein